jgi:hypothetical protein
LIGTPEEKSHLGKPRDRWKKNITLGLGEIGWGGLDWIHLARDRDHRSKLNVDDNKYC